ncbi:MAG TPA: mechanosensitive ion channel family protein [Pyrinomonadaceae bacterium]|nr:mechanosensitive ion channel family protein [Pyrinomonadaceae bacterium]
MIKLGILVALLVSLPILEGWINTTLLPELGLAVNEGVLSNVVVSERGTLSFTPATMITQTTFAIVLILFKVLRVLFVMMLVIAIVRFVSHLITSSRNKSDSSAIASSSILQTVLSVIIYIIAFFVVFQSQFPDIPLAPLFTGSTILGIVVGLALQDTLGNLFAGVALQADQPFQIGDVVVLSNRGSGVVEDVSWRGVKIRTFSNSLLMISNAVLGKEIIDVARKEDAVARNVFFSTGYGHSPATTQSVVREAIRAAENVSNKFRPVVRIRNLGADGIEWEVKYWLDDYSRFNDTDALIRERIWYAFQRESITIPYPTRTLHVERGSGHSPVEHHYDLVSARLSNVPIFDPLSEEEIALLAEKVKKRVYAPGELIVRSGTEGSSMFIIDRGKVAIQIYDNGNKIKVNELGESDFFGEMSLLTGEPRTADVVALVETEVMQIRRNSLKPVLEANPLLAQSITDIVAERRAKLNASQDTGVTDQAEVKKGIIRSIRKLFGLSKRKGEAED